VIRYNETFYEEYTASTVEECFKDKDFKGVSWINIDGTPTFSFIESLTKPIGVHPLFLEDIRNTLQRPKVDEYEDYLFVLMKMLDLNEAEEVTEEQVSLIINTNTVLSFQETPGDVFNNVRDRLRNSKGMARTFGADYLAYSLIDAVVDNYFKVLEKIGDKIEVLEEELLDNPSTAVLHELHKARREMIILRRSVWPLRSVVSFLEQCGHSVLGSHMRIYFRDIYDHTVQIIDTVETNRDVISSILDIYLSSVNNKLNEIMKFLTIIGTIFIPLSFIASLYGMNFRYMPEIEQIWGYPYALALMLITTIILLLYFRRKKWI
jgi:magnesium transporter